MIERLTPAALTGTAKRADNFRADPDALGFSPTPQDYTDPANPRDRDAAASSKLRSLVDYLKSKGARA